jgi:PAS domain S-box-containing protein
MFSLPLALAPKALTGAMMKVRSSLIAPVVAISKWPVRLRWQLFLLAAGAIAPVLALALAAVFLLVNHERETMQREALGRARSAMSAVDAELRGYFTTLTALAASKHLESGDMRAFYEEAKRVLATQPSWLNVGLASSTRKQLMDAAMAFGGEQPLTGDLASYELAVRGEREVVGNVDPGAVVREPSVRIRVPVAYGGTVRYVLTVPLKPDSFAQVLRAQRLPEDWVIALVDRNRNFIARIPPMPAGQPASESFRAHMGRAPEGWFRGRTVEGFRTYTPYVTSDLSGWVLGIAIPASTVEAAAWRSAGIMAVALIAALSVAFWIAWLVSKRIARPVAALAAATDAMGRGEEVEFHDPGSIEEILKLHDALRRAHGAIREREERFRVMADAAPVMVWMAGTDKLCTWFNKAWLDFAGRPMERELGNGWAENVHPDDFERCLQIYSSAFDARQPFSMEYRLRRHDGEYRWLRDDGIPRFEAKGTFAGYIGACMDITERRRAEEALREAEERTRSVVDHVVDGIITIDESGAIQTFNPAAERIFGYVAAEVIGQNVKMLMPDPYRREHDGYIANYVRSGQPKIIGIGREVEGLRKDGSTFPLDLAVSVFHLGPRRYFTGVVRDITERKQAEIALKEANRAKDEFLAMLSHELRNPLAALTSSAHVLKVVPPSSADAVKARGVVERQTKHMTRLVSDLLDINRVTLGKLSLQRERFNAAEALFAVIDVWRATGRLESHMVSPSLEPVWVEGDRVRIEQIASNLLDNAIKFTPAGKKITVSLRREDREAVLRVADEGIGVAPEECSRIFELFVQGNFSPRAGGGLGIGLALVKRLAELHGGSASAASEGQGRGMTLTVRLPAVDQPTVQAKTPSVDVASRRSILIVEDNDDARQMLQAILSLDGHQVCAARDGKSGLGLAAETWPDLALIDIALPDMDGYEVARRLRTLNGDRRIDLIAISAFGQARDQRRAYEVGFDAYLVKPVVPERLKQVIAGLR